MSPWSWTSARLSSSAHGLGTVRAEIPDSRRGSGLERSGSGRSLARRTAVLWRPEGDGGGDDRPVLGCEANECRLESDGLGA
jgi:hypothetical protein